MIFMSGWIHIVHYQRQPYNLLTSGKLYSHLADTEEQAQALFSRLVKEYAEKESVNEQLKSTDQMAWVQKMNNIRSRVIEVVNAEVVFVWENENTTCILPTMSTTSSFMPIQLPQQANISR